MANTQSWYGCYEGSNPSLETKVKKVELTLMAREWSWKPLVIINLMYKFKSYIPRQYGGKCTKGAMNTCNVRVVGSIPTVSTMLK